MPVAFAFTIRQRWKGLCLLDNYQEEQNIVHVYPNEVKNWKVNSKTHLTIMVVVKLAIDKTLSLIIFSLLTSIITLWRQFVQISYVRIPNILDIKNRWSSRQAKAHNQQTRMTI